MSDIAKRAVACKHWRWMPGMLAIVGVERQRVLSDKLHAYHDWIPDLTDAATIGCLLALVREAWGDDGICPDFNKMRWTILTWDCCAIGDGSTEADALVAALEAAPC